MGNCSQCRWIEITVMHKRFYKSASKKKRRKEEVDRAYTVNKEILTILIFSTQFYHHCACATASIAYSGCADLTVILF